MASSPVTAPSSSPDAPSPPQNSTPPESSPSDKSPSPPNSPPPPEKASPLPPEKSSPPPPSEKSSPPPPSNSKSPPPPDDNDNDSEPSPPPPTKKSPPSDHVYAPPPPRSSSSSPLALSPPNSSQRSSSSGSSIGDKLPLIVGVSLGTGLVLLTFLVCCVCAIKKKKRRQDPMYYGSLKGSEYYSGQVKPNYHQSGEHVVKLPPPPGGMGGHGQGGGWPAPPPPPPPMMSSGEMSSADYSHGGGMMPPPSPGISLGFSKSTFTYEELAAATNGFSQSNMLGQGGFGYVHKGVLPTGKEIAVKSLKTGSGQGEREFQAEVEIISRVHHRHLVSLVGYCIAGGQRMLVYEFVPNKTLEYHLHGAGRPPMDWSSRLRIAVGSAKGLAYLHEDCHPRIIHRDIKAANILLDYRFEAMVADFGLAKLSSDNYTHVSTRIMGTFGYLAPEYASSGKLTEKSDVFSFGVMLLEIITGRRPVDTTNVQEDSLVDWARPLLENPLEHENYDELADPRLEGNYNPQEFARMVACASVSIRHSAKRRPRMSQIVRTLEGDTSVEDLIGGTRPGQSAVYGNSTGSSDYDTAAYNADMKKIRKTALSSQEFSDEYGGTGEFGTHGPSSSSGDSREMRRPI